MSKPDKPIVVMVAVYTTEIDGDLTLATLNQWKKDGKIEVIDAAVMVSEEPLETSRSRSLENRASKGELNVAPSRVGLSASSSLRQSLP